MVGIVLNSIAKKWVTGVSMDFSKRLYLQVGVHAARVSQLDPASGLEVGDSVREPQHGGACGPELGVRLVLRGHGGPRSWARPDSIGVRRTSTNSGEANRSSA